MLEGASPPEEQRSASLVFPPSCVTYLPRTRTSSLTFAVDGKVSSLLLSKEPRPVTFRRTGGGGAPIHTDITQTS